MRYVNSAPHSAQNILIVSVIFDKFGIHTILRITVTVATQKSIECKARFLKI